MGSALATQILQDKSYESQIGEGWLVVSPTINGSFWRRCDCHWWCGGSFPNFFSTLREPNEISWRPPRSGGGGVAERDGDGAGAVIVDDGDGGD